jgi:hypothetical protein
MNKNANGIIAVKVIEAGYLRSHSSPFMWAIRNACLIGNVKEAGKIPLLFSSLPVFTTPNSRMASV